MLLGGRSGTCCYAVALVGVWVVFASCFLQLIEHQSNVVHFSKNNRCRNYRSPRTTAAACDRILDYSQRDLASLEKWGALCRQHASMAPVEPPLTKKINKNQAKVYTIKMDTQSPNLKKKQTALHRSEAMENSPLQQSSIAKLLTA